MSNLVLSSVLNEPEKESATDHSSSFGELRWRLIRNTWNSLVGGSMVRPLTIVFSSLIVWIFVFAVSLGGFRFLSYEGLLPLSGQLVGILFDLLFVSLGFFLMFSGGLILYGSLFTSAETAFLLSLPVPADKIFAYKFQTAVSFSSWAFLLLGAPILIAYGGVCESPWFFYLLLPVFFLGFVLIPSSIGAILCLLIVNYFPRKKKQFWLIVASVAILGLGFWIWSNLPARRTPRMIQREEVNRLLDRFAFASNIYVPSHWVVNGLRAAAAGKSQQALYYLAVVWSNGLMLYLLTAWLAGRIYRRGYNRIATGGTIRKRYGGHWMDRCLETLLFFLKPTTRILLVKDFRTFRRDPQQWAQILIFFVLMLLYIFNIRKMFINGIEWRYQNGISFLNLAAVSMLMCTYTGRFVFPLLSLEGRKFWILGLLPIRREMVLWGKFAFSSTGTLIISIILILLSDLFLEMPGTIVVLHLLAVMVISLGLSGMSVGVGAILPNFKENDPSKIAVGFGGTLNLVIGLFYILAVLGMMAIPWHVMMARGQNTSLTWLSSLLVILGASGGILLGVCAIVIPLHLGVESLRKMEF